MTTPGTITVASVPSSHVYVRHLSVQRAIDPAATEVVRLPDPDPDGGHPGSIRPAGARWWPPAMLEPHWVREHRHEFDLFHLHFGFDARTPDQLRALTQALREEGKPFVYTVHDLRNPHHEDPALHAAQLDVLIPAADRLLTLTPWAAGEIERRWGRRADVVSHPHVVDILTMRRLAEDELRDPGEFRVGLHLKSLRANMDVIPMIDALSEAVGTIPGGVLQVNAHRDIVEEDGARYDPEVASRLRDEGLDVRVHDFFRDEEFFAYLAGLHVSVLPYRFGTHSGWLEACRDVGTRVLAPALGGYADQGADALYHRDATGRLDAGSVREALRALAAAPSAWPARAAGHIAWRARQRGEIAAVHERIYRGLLERGAGDERQAG
ncbi:glycosyltransferase family 1 protein [Sediminivirga luteola]|uniref:glycosyltransferase family 1 protein n=1 Tax=Sediminivirga luteola TaxID=1774748 RepID=UPI001F579504|nr:glycosyltransferase family 1 protein [Sediminivirga luteola]MCI2264014.1 glycosyltransferase family 1 protein [Sediminivirga luteola]